MPNGWAGGTRLSRGSPREHVAPFATHQVLRLVHPSRGSRVGLWDSETGLQYRGHAGPTFGYAISVGVQETGDGWSTSIAVMIGPAFTVLHFDTTATPGPELAARGWPPVTGRLRAVRLLRAISSRSGYPLRG